MREDEQPQGRQTLPCGSLARPLASALVDDAGPGEVAASADEGPLRRRRDVAPGARCSREPLVQGGKRSIEELRQRDVDTVVGHHVLGQLPATLGEGRIRPQLDAQIEDVAMSERCGVRRDVAGATQECRPLRWSSAEALRAHDRRARRQPTRRPDRCRPAQPPAPMQRRGSTLVVIAVREDPLRGKTAPGALGAFPCPPDGHLGIGVAGQLVTEVMQSHCM